MRKFGILLKLVGVTYYGVDDSHWYYDDVNGFYSELYHSFVVDKTRFEVDCPVKAKKKFAELVKYYKNMYPCTTIEFEIREIIKKSIAASTIFYR